MTEPAGSSETQPAKPTPKPPPLASDTWLAEMRASSGKSTRAFVNGVSAGVIGIGTLFTSAYVGDVINISDRWEEPPIVETQIQVAASDPIQFTQNGTTYLLYQGGNQQPQLYSLSTTQIDTGTRLDVDPNATDDPEDTPPPPDCEAAARALPEVPANAALKSISAAIRVGGSDLYTLVFQAGDTDIAITCLVDRLTGEVDVTPAMPVATAD